jgi:hypothetical protein
VWTGYQDLFRKERVPLNIVNNLMLWEYNILNNIFLRSLFSTQANINLFLTMYAHVRTLEVPIGIAVNYVYVEQKSSNLWKGIYISKLGLNNFFLVINFSK